MNSVAIQASVIFFNLLFMISSLSRVFDVPDLSFQLFQPVVYLVQTFCYFFISSGRTGFDCFYKKPCSQCDQRYEKEPDTTWSWSEYESCGGRRTWCAAGYKREKGNRIDPLCVILLIL